MLSKLLRRTHLYLALFLTPWILMYAASTFVMNHRVWFRSLYGGPPPTLALEREQPYDAVFPEGAGAKQMGAQILAGLNLEGTFNATQRPRDGAVIINRLDPVTPRRITYYPAARKVTIERLPWESRAYLERMHRRRGYQYDRPLEDTWAFSVDLFIVAVIFWVASGVWMWWEMKTTRRWGALAAAAGIAVFALFVVTI
jgi:hypothetical protein